MTCNLCGNPLQLEPNCERAGLVDAVVSGGYSSTPGNGSGALDDCTEYRFSMCEFCLDWLFTEFRIPPTMRERNGDPDNPRQWRPAHLRVAEDEWRTQKLRFSDESLRRAMGRPNFRY